MTQPLSEGRHMDRVHNFAKMIVAEEERICLVVGGEGADSDVIGRTRRGETEEPSRLGGREDKNMTPWVLGRVS